jgi:hypothetical protein
MPIPERLVAALSVATVVLTLAFRADYAIAASCSGNSHALTLSGGTANPGSGTTATKFTFRVTYTDNDGCAPDRIVVVVVGVGTYALSYVGGGLQSGATFARSMLLPAGRWGYQFEASSGSGAGRRQAKLTNVNPAKVAVSKPAAKPTPEPVVTPAPTPRRTAVPTKQPPPPRASASPSATAAAATPTAAPKTARPTADPSPTKFDMPGARTPDPGAPIALLKLVVSTIGTIGGLILFAALYGRMLRPAPTIQLPPVARRRRDDPPPASEPGT